VEFFFRANVQLNHPGGGGGLEERASKLLD